MCTLVILRRPEHDWPLIVAANRDEKLDRPSLSPARHWPDRDNVVAGRDELAGGTWLGVNDDGVVAGILNRTGTLGPDPDLRSRGELPLEALDHAEAEAVAEALFDLDPNAYRPFNMFVGDARKAFWISSLNEYGEPGMRVGDIPMGNSMLTDCDLNDGQSPRVRLYLPRFEKALPPEPDSGQWDWWQALLADKEFANGVGPKGAMNVNYDDGFGTVSSSLIALPSLALHPQKPYWIFAPGAPDITSFEAIDL
jgi:uncharacterized protein with NRDE domain|tara:strand:- start:182 stop:940 length:759 start_codon:yes stop_codon:yes gene_type:complete